MFTKSEVHFALYVLYFQLTVINSRTSNLWKLNTDQTKIVEASPFKRIDSLHFGAHFITEDDPVFNIITSTVFLDHAWSKKVVEYYCTHCHTTTLKTATTENDFGVRNNSNVNKDINITTVDFDETLDCGKPVNFTYYDSLVGVLNRNRHPNVPEPQIALIFPRSKKNKIGNSYELDVNALERRLKKAKKEKPKSVQLYNQIGNFWRIKGDVQKAIECYRRALAVSPHNSEVLLNLARVLFTLQYLDDAVYLTRRSLEVHPTDKSAWQQYFTLGEIFKAYGHYQEASLHLKHTLELKPGFEPAQVALRQMATMPANNIHVYTLLIIMSLVGGVLLVILSSVDLNIDNESQENRIHKHFNRAMAMRSLRGIGISQKNIRPKKLTA